MSADVLADGERDRKVRAFDRAAAGAAESMRADLHEIEDLLFNAKVVLTRTGTVSMTSLRGLASDVSLFERYPALLSIGVITFVPDAELADHIRQVTADPPDNSEPDDAFHLVPGGQREVYCLSPARLARPEVRDPLGTDYCAGTPAGALDAVRADDKTLVMPVVVGDRQAVTVSSSLYRTTVTPSTPEERRSQFVGQFGLMFDPAALIADAVSTRPGVTAQLTYEPDAETAQLVGNLPPFGSAEPPTRALNRTVDLGSGWSARLATAAPPAGILRHDTAVAVAAVGMLCSVLLAAMVQILATGRSRARRMVAAKTDELQHLALHDPLTGLANRALLNDRATQLIARSRRGATKPSCLYLDLDRFKSINDSFGHETGDLVLAHVGACLRAVLRDADTIARVGGDEFVILLDGGEREADPIRVAERILDVLRQPFECDVPGAVLVISASIGIATGDRQTADDLIRDADFALYEAKALGKDQSVTFAAGRQVKAQQGVEFEQDLRSALERGQYRLVYQPIYNLDDLSVVGFEALLRWDHPILGEVQPNDFIPLLERSGMIIDVGRWVIREACRQLAVWRRAGSDATVSVNVAALQLDSGCVLDDIRAGLAAASLEPSALVVEITESSLMQSLDTCVEQLVALRKLGVQVAIDDFGTGYSSLALLPNLPVDCLKIDRSFIAAMDQGAGARALVRAIAQLSKDLGLRTLAEGVETTAQVDDLRLDHIDEAQGFLLARPLDPETIEHTILGITLPAYSIASPTQSDPARPLDRDSDGWDRLAEQVAMAQRAPERL